MFPKFVERGMEWKHLTCAYFNGPVACFEIMKVYSVSNHVQGGRKKTAIKSGLPLSLPEPLFLCECSGASMLNLKSNVAHFS